MIKGTYGYMAPEQVTGGEAVTPRADVYAAAIILWELLTRRRAFQRGALPEMEALRAMAEPRLPALESIRSDVDRTVREALRRALEPRADRRKITAEEMVSILTGVVPLEQGRERLTTLLNLVRNDARAASAQASIAPPAMVPTSAGAGPAPQLFIPQAPKTVDFGSMNSPPLIETTPSRLMHKVSMPPRPSSARMLAATPPSEPSLADTAKVAPAKIPGLDSNAPDPPTPRISSQNIPAAAVVGAGGPQRIPSLELPAVGSGDALRGPGVPPPVPPPRISSAKMQVAAPLEPSVRELLSMPTRPAMPAVSGVHSLVAPPPPNRPASKPQLPAAKAPPGASDPPRRPSAAEQLAAAVPDEMVNALESIAPSRPMSILDSLTDSVPPPSMGRMTSPPDSPRTSKPLKDLTGGLGLRDAIDEIMRASSRGLPAAPLAEAPLAEASLGEASEAAADLDADESSSDKPLQRPTTRVPPDVAQALIGQIPPAPPPMEAPELASTPPEASVATSPPPKDEFANAYDDPEEPVDTVIQPEPLPPPTPRRLTPVVQAPEGRASTPSQPTNAATTTRSDAEVPATAAWLSCRAGVDVVSATARVGAPVARVVEAAGRRSGAARKDRNWRRDGRARARRAHRPRHRRHGRLRAIAGAQAACGCGSTERATRAGRRSGRHEAGGDGVGGPDRLDLGLAVRVGRTGRLRLRRRRPPPRRRRPKRSRPGWASSRRRAHRRADASSSTTRPSRRRQRPSR